MSLFGNLFGPSSSSSSSPPRRGSSSSGREGTIDKGEPYSFLRLQHLYDRLARFRESDLERGGGGDMVVETVRQITELLIWGEQNDEHFFDFFCEKNILADFVRVLGLPKAPKKVRLQLLQSLSMLVGNIKLQTSVYYLLSNNHINRLFLTQMDFEDEEILAYYITMMKSLAMRLDRETVKFFFLQLPSPTFPLYTEATKLFDHRDQMVRTTVRTITLQVYRIDDQPMQRFVLRHAAESYFSKLAYHLRDLWLRLDAAASGARELEDLKGVQREHELQQDLLIYLSDVFELGKEELNEVLADRLLNCAMLPVLLTGVMAVRGYDVVDITQGRVLMPSVALFLLRQVFDIFRCPSLLTPLASALLQPTVPAALAYVLPQCPSLAGTHSSPSLQQDFLPNWLREHFLTCLLSTDDAVFLLSCSVVHGCLERSEVLLPSLLSQQAVAVTPKEGFQPGTSAVEFLVTGVEDSPMRGHFSPDLPAEDRFMEGNLQVYHCLLQALYKYDDWHIETLRVLARIILDGFTNPLIQRNATAQSDLRQVARAVSAEAAARAHEVLEQCLAEGDGGDWFLDIFLDQWEASQAPYPEVVHFCGDPRRLLPVSHWGVGPPQLPRKGTFDGADAGPGAGGASRLSRLDPGGAGQRLVRNFLLLQRLLKEVMQSSFAEFGTHDDGRDDGAVEEEPTQAVPSPHFFAGLPDRVQQAPGDFDEGKWIDTRAFRRVVCGVTLPKGKCTRYLLLHDEWLLLVQPDVANPGTAAVRTVWPLWEVQSYVDRGDPRALQLFVSQRCARARPGDLGVARGVGPPASDTPIVLTFEDVANCTSASEHIERRRRCLRAELMGQLAAAVGQCSEGHRSQDGV